MIVWGISDAGHETRVDIRLRVERRVNAHGESYKRPEGCSLLDWYNLTFVSKKRRYLTQYPVLCLGAGPGVRLFFLEKPPCLNGRFAGNCVFFVLWSQTDSRDALSHCWAHGHPGVLPSTVGYSEAGQPRYAKSTYLCLTFNQ